MKQLFYGSLEEDRSYPIEVYDTVEVMLGDLRIPTVVKKVMPRLGKVEVTFGGDDSELIKIIALRKTARVPASALDLVGRGM